MTKNRYLHNYYNFVNPFIRNNDLETGRVNVSGEVAHFGEEIAKIEGFLRLLWAEAFNFDGRNRQDYPYFQNLCKGILTGCDKTSKYYWGEIPDYGQLFVEMVALSVFLIESKSDFWDTLTCDQKENITSYMNQITDAEIPLNNWQFFKVMVQVAFYKLESSYFSESALADALNVVHSYYRDEGFYTDGDNNSKDYYISWAFHYYGLLYDRYMSEFDPKNANLFIQRTNDYLPAYLAHFDSDGIAVAYGRSLAYRFAQAALLSMIALTDKISIDTNLLGNLLAGHLDYWNRQDIKKNDGTLAVGYAYPNILMAENYNSSGSSYWAFKFFAILGCPPEHGVFAPSSAFLETGRQHFVAGNFISERTDDQTFFYPVNNTAGTTGYKDKYHKFVYSTKFAFSVSKGVLQLNEGAFDNTLAIYDPDTHTFLTKLSEETYEVFNDRLCFTWLPKKGVKVKTTVIPEGNRHRRIHEISTDVPLEIFDMGFSNDALKNKDVTVTRVDKEVTIQTSYGEIGSVGIEGYDEAFEIHTVPSTHLLFKKAVMTGLKAKIEAGVHSFESAHYAFYKND